MRAAAGEGAPGTRRAAGLDRKPAAPFPWEAVQHAGLHLLRLSPRDFWAMTPREFFAMTGGLKPPAVTMERAGLDALMQAFPDGAVCPSP